MITNKHDLPEFVVRLTKHFQYAKKYQDKRYSATEIIRSPRQYWLRRRHQSEIEEDICDLWASTIGSALHKACEDVEVPGDEVEVHLAVTLPNGVTLTGMIDRLNPMEIIDYKFSAHSSLFNFEHPEWEQQLNIYRLLVYLSAGCVRIDNLYVLGMAPDFREKKWSKDIPAKLFRIPVWSLSEAREFVERRVMDFELCKGLLDDDLPKCTTYDEVGKHNDCWERPHEWALKKKGRKSAVKLFDSEEDALRHKEKKKLGDNHFLEYRRGVRNMCENYCSAAPFCNQYKEWLGDA
jgi:hypothetical protein